MGLFGKLFGQIKGNTKKVVTMNPNDIWFTCPTISNEFPQTVPASKQTESDIQIPEDDYRQNEFLNLNAQKLIEEEFIAINEIWDHHSRKTEDYTLFKNCHVRNKIGAPNLTINFNDLKSLLKKSSAGQVIINGDVLANGFSLKTENTTFYGTLNNDQVSELCISQWNENSAKEIMEVNKEFHLLFVNWYHCDMIKND